MSPIKMCRLCEAEKELQLSHIIPRSLIKRRKLNGQTIRFTVGEGAKKENYDPKEFLLCHECEQYISNEFEYYGIDLLRNRSNVKKVEGGIIFNNFNYSKFYLFLTSILWRASISTIPIFKHIDLRSELNDLIRSCILKNTLKIQTSIRLSHIVKISILRVVDKNDDINDLLKGVLFNLNYECSQNQIDYYFMVDGFLIIYNLTLHKDIHELRCDRIYAQLKNTRQLFVPTCDFRNFPQIYNAFSSMADEARRFD
ncbi:MAG: hypothetical protein ACRDCY_17530 [Aeromonas veronii]